MKRLEMGEMELRQLGQYLRRVEFFKDLNIANIEKIYEYIQLYSFKLGEMVFKEGGPADALYIVYQGGVEIKKKKWFFLPGKKIKDLGPGDFLGEMALLDDKPRSASAQARAHTQLFVLMVADFDLVMENNPNFSREMKSIAQKRKWENARFLGK